MTPDPEQFAISWAAAWNAHDVEAVLAHFAEAAVFSSPVATRLVPGSDGVLRGKSALRDYWTTAIGGLPDLQFAVVGVYAGIDTLVINYRNQRGGLVCEVLTFDGDLVIRGGGTYLANAAADVGAMDAADLRLTGERVVLVPVGGEHVEDLRQIRRMPQVEARWGVESYAPPWPFGDPGAVVFTVLVDGQRRGHPVLRRRGLPARRGPARLRAGRRRGGVARRADDGAPRQRPSGPLSPRAP